MNFSKFIVYIMCISLFRIYFAEHQHQTESSQKEYIQGNLNTEVVQEHFNSNRAIDKVINIKKITIEYKYKSRPYNFLHKMDGPQISQPEITNLSNNYNDEFRFMVTGGYRPEKNRLIQYLASIRRIKEAKFFGDNHFCGGCIISPKIILTAAHCLYVKGAKLRANKIKVIVGTPRRLLKTENTQELMVTQVKPHPKFSNTLFTNDIGIVKLKNEVHINEEFASIIPLNDRDPTSGMICTVVGWGTVIQYGPTPDEAVNGDVTINTNAFCSSIPGFRRGMLCASNTNDYEVDSCQGDSGGPLICNEKAVGIVSYGIGCGEPDSAGVYTDVYHFRSWIAHNVGCRSGRRLLITCMAYILLIFGYLQHV